MVLRPDLVHTGDMGSSGIRRRKPAHRLPKVRDADLPTENDLIPPNIMWPAKGSGFEADPFSPAGSAQRGWWLLNAARRGRTRRARTLGWIYLLLIAIPITIGLLSHIVHTIR